MTEWLIWTLSVSAAAIFVPLAIGELAIRGGFFRKDADDVSRSMSRSDRMDLANEFEIAGPEPDLNE